MWSVNSAATAGPDAGRRAKPRVVVVMPAYNAAKTLRITYGDIPQQRVDGIILVDDGSTDETLAIARSRVGAAHVQFVVGDAYRLPVAPGGFAAGFAGFWFSHVPRSRVAEFLRGFHAALAPGARVVLLDNRFVPGSSTPLSERDGEGDSCVHAVAFPWARCRATWPNVSGGSSSSSGDPEASGA